MSRQCPWQTFRLKVWKHRFYALHITIRNQSRLAETTAALGVLFGEDVTFESLVSFNLTGARFLETFRGTAVRFQLWHVEPLLRLDQTFFLFL